MSNYKSKADQAPSSSTASTSSSSQLYALFQQHSQRSQQQQQQSTLSPQDNRNRRNQKYQEEGLKNVDIRALAQQAQAQRQAQRQPSHTTPPSSSSTSTPSSSSSSAPIPAYQMEYQQCKLKEQQLIHALQSATGQHMTANPSTLRAELISSYSHLLQSHPSFCLLHHVANKLWAIMYKEMDAIITELKHQKDSNTDRYEWSNKLTLVLERHFSSLDMLASSMDSQLQREGKEHELHAVNAGSMDAQVKRGGGGKDQEQSALKAILAELCMGMGDIERYRQLYIVPLSAPSSTSSSNFSRAALFYERALNYDASYGKAHNQLAVVAQYTDNEFEACYQYIRAIDTIVHPFPARENLLALYERNRQHIHNVMYQSSSSQGHAHAHGHGHGGGKGRGGGGNVSLHMPAGSHHALFDCLGHFIHLIAILDTRISTEQFDVISNIFLQQFQSCIVRPLEAEYEQAATAGSTNHTFLLIALKLLLLNLHILRVLLEKDLSKYEPSTTSAVLGQDRHEARNKAGNSNLTSMSSPLLSAPWSIPPSLYPSLTPSTPLGLLSPSSIPALPFAPSQLSGMASRLCLQMLTALLHIPVRLSQQHISPSSTLPLFSLIFFLLRAYFPALCTMENSYTEAFRNQLVQYVNLLLPNRNTLLSSTSSSSPSSFSYEQFHGFQLVHYAYAYHYPQLSFGLFDEVAFQCQQIFLFSDLLLFYHPHTHRYSAYAIPKSILSEAEYAELQASKEQYVREKEEEKQREMEMSMKKKKRPSKQPNKGPSSHDEAAMIEEIQQLAIGGGGEHKAHQYVPGNDGVDDEQPGVANPIQPPLTSPDDELVLVDADQLLPAQSSDTQSESTTGQHEQDDDSIAAILGVPGDSVPNNPASVLATTQSSNFIPPSNTYTSKPFDSQLDIQLNNQANVRTAHADIYATSSSSAVGAQAALLKPLIILDAPNIAMRHGDNKLFSTRGITIAMEYFEQRGYKVIAFAPEYYLDYEYVNGKKRQDQIGFTVKASKMPDSVTALIQLSQSYKLFTTPKQDYDDTYTIQYAMSHEALLISNDQYRDHIDNQPTPDLQQTARAWIRTNVITFTFIGQEEFMPNPQVHFTVDGVLRNRDVQQDSKYRKAQYNNR